MRRLIAAMMLTTFVLAVCAQAQDCSDWTNWDVRGTYTAAGQRLDAPDSWVGAIALNGTGGGTGWVSANNAGIQVNVQLVDLTYSVKADCSVQMTVSMKIKELGITVGPLSRIMVIMGKAEDLEVRGMWVGTGPGSEVDTFVARRISMRF